MTNAKPGLLHSLLRLLAYRKPQLHNAFHITPAPNTINGHGEDFGAETERFGTAITKELEQNLTYLAGQFSARQNTDFIIRRFTVGAFSMAVVYLDGMSSRKEVSDFILRPLMRGGLHGVLTAPQLAEALPNVVEASCTETLTDLDEGIRGILSGDTLLLSSGLTFALLCETKGYEKRSVSTPQIEGSVKGSQEAFTENMKTNVSLLRRIIKSPRLVSEYMSVGDLNRSNCAIIYVRGLCSPSVIDEVRRRVSSLKGDFIMGSGMLEQFVEDDPFSLFPTLLTTERPDRTASALNEGRVAVIIDGTPFSLIMPVTLLTMITTTEDTALRWQYGTLLRFVRVVALLASVFLPAVFLSLTNFHSEMIPTDLLIAIAKTRENVPFPTFVELLLMILSFEMVREASTRVPGIIGDTIGIVGALILGQAAVEAHLVSPVLIIIVAFTGIGAFALPDYSLNFGVRIIRLLLLLGAITCGFVGIALGTAVVMCSIVSQTSFGVPVMIGFDSPRRQTNHNLIWRRPIWRQELRNHELETLHQRNQPPVSRGWTKEPDNNDKA